MTPASPRLKRVRSTLLYLIFIVLAIIILNLALEGGVRTYGWVKDRTSPAGKQSVSPVTVIYERYPEYGIEFHAPKQDFIDNRIPARKYHVTINSLGFRGTEFAEKKPPNTLRIMLLGDSFTYGDGVNNEDTLSQQMEDILRERHGGKYEVINAGRMGAFLESETRLYENYAKGFAPDILVLLYCYNDLSEIVYFDYYKRTLYGDTGTGGSGADITRWASREARKSAAYNMLLQKKAERIATDEYKFLRDKAGRLKIGMPVEPYRRGENKLIDRAVSQYEEQLLAFRVEMKKKNVGFLFVLFPTPLKDTDIRRPVNRELHAFAVKNGVSALDLRKSWLDADHDIFSFFDVDTHPNAKAFRISAGEIISKLESENMIERQ